MKRIIALLLCLVLSCLAFTGCSKDNIDAFRKDLEDNKHLDQTDKRQDVVLDFYIIFEEGTTEEAMVSVTRAINAYLPTIKLNKDYDELKTELRIHYETMAEYQAKVESASELSGDERADIVLIVGKDMFDDFMRDNRLADITEYYDSKVFGLLKTQIANSLIEASKQTVKTVDTTGKEYDSIRLYSVPNNRVVGEYKYLLINTEIAEYYRFYDNDLASMVTYEDTEELRNRITNDGLDPAQYVIEVTGTYADKEKYENEGYTVQIVSKPTVTAEDAFAYSFGIVRHELDTRYMYEMDKAKNDKISKESREAYEAHYLRCMEVIYALNSDAKFRNLLQYGSLGTNYSYNEETNTVTRFSGVSGEYKINIYYTGDIFKAYYCDDFAWNEEAYNNGQKQNVESSAAK